MAGIMEAIKEYLRSHGVMRAAVYVIGETTVVQTYGNYPWYATPDDDMIARMLDLFQDKNQHGIESQASFIKECIPEY